MALKSAVMLVLNMVVERALMKDILLVEKTGVVMALLLDFEMDHQ